MITFEQIKNNKKINSLIFKGNKYLGVMGYTEHGYAHAQKVSDNAGNILKILEYSEREEELAKIAGYIHDIGNVINRNDHAQSGALMAFRILDNLGMNIDEITDIVSAVGNHDEGTSSVISPISAALILADKSDVRRSRVRNAIDSNSTITPNFLLDIHDRVNYAVTKSDLFVKSGLITLKLEIDPDISPILDYFEIFLSRMMLCRRASDFLNCKFELIINGNKLL